MSDEIDRKPDEEGFAWGKEKDIVAPIQEGESEELFNESPVNTGLRVTIKR